MTAESFLFLLISIAILTIKPGPGMVAIVTRALQDGFFPAFAIALGLASMHLIYFPVAAFSFSIEGALAQKLTFSLQMAGALYIIWMGVKGLRNRHKNPWDHKRKTGAGAVFLQNYMTGLVINLSSPFIVLFYVGLIPTIFDFQTIGTMDVVIATSVTFGIIMSFLTLECALAAQLREVLKDYNFVHRMNFFSSIIMIGIGVFVALSALNVWNVTLT